MVSGPYMLIISLSTYRLKRLAGVPKTNRVNPADLIMLVLNTMRQQKNKDGSFAHIVIKNYQAADNSVRF